MTAEEQLAEAESDLNWCRMKLAQSETHIAGLRAALVKLQNSEAIPSIANQIEDIQTQQALARIQTAEQAMQVLDPQRLIIRLKAWIAREAEHHGHMQAECSAADRRLQALKSGDSGN